MVFDDEEAKFLSPPTIKYFPQSYLAFKKASKAVIKDFFAQIERLRKLHKKPVTIEFKIVFHAPHVPYLTPAKESKFVYRVFKNDVRKIRKKSKTIKVKPQLRRRLSGRGLKIFKKELRSLYLVSRKRDTGFEYHLWEVALHATSQTYAAKLRKIRSNLVDAMWEGK